MVIIKQEPEELLPVKVENCSVLVKPEENLADTAVDYELFNYSTVECSCAHVPVRAPANASSAPNEFQQLRHSLPGEINQTKAMKNFCLSKKELFDNLRHQKCFNPGDPTYRPANMFKRSEVKALALSKYGSMEAIQAEKDSRAVKREQQRQIRKLRAAGQRPAGALPTPAVQHAQAGHRSTAGRSRRAGSQPRAKRSRVSGVGTAVRYLGPDAQSL